MKPLLPALVVALSALAAPAAPAQTQVKRAQVYRCGPDGRDLRDSPCPGVGAASSVDYDQPGAADSKAARERHLAEARQATALAQARRASEAEARAQRTAAVGLQRLPPPATAASATATTAPPRRPHMARAHKPAKPAQAASATGR
ncbi:hypothetical protein [Roseateles sp.]|uniref:hypothetical protein n=1 Tax=Roseateles sp. TaxID=1971397 RepID=UPI003BA9FAF4